SNTGAKRSPRSAAPNQAARPRPAAETRSGSRLAEVIQKVEDAIADGRLVPGQRLVEADLTAEFGVSRSVIREALRLLAGEGVVELAPNRGCRVKRIEPQRLVYMLEVYSALFRTALEILVSKPIRREVRLALKGALDGVVKASKSSNIR